MSDNKQVKPWWREPWPWILMAGPAVAVVGCVITIYLAFNSYPDQTIKDGSVRRGLVVVPAKATTIDATAR